MKKNEISHNDAFEQSVKKGELINSLVGPYAKALLIETANGLFAIQPDDFGVGGDLRAYGNYGTAQIDLVAALLNNSSKLLVVGAHVGTLTIPLARLCSSVTAIEANPQTFKLLQLNIELNKISNCEIFNIAASEKFETIPFLLNTVNSGGSKRKPQTDHRWYNYDSPEEILIDAVPLDDYLKERLYDVVVMDIEGSEYFALKGMPEILSNANTLIIEFLPHHLKNVSGITISDFFAVLPRYKTLTIPSANITIAEDKILEVLQYMYNNDIEDEGLVFKK